MSIEKTTEELIRGVPDPLTSEQYKSIFDIITQTRIDTLKEVEEWVKKEKEWVHQIEKNNEVDPQKSKYAQLGRKTVLDDLLTHIQSLLDNK